MPFTECFKARDALRLDPKMTDHELFEKHYLGPASTDASHLSKMDMMEDATRNESVNSHYQQ